MVINRIGIGSLAKPVFLPLLYGALGAVALSVVGLPYKLAARTVGGVRIDVDPTV